MKKDVTYKLRVVLGLQKETWWDKWKAVIGMGVYFGLFVGVADGFTWVTMSCYLFLVLCITTWLLHEEGGE